MQTIIRNLKNGHKIRYIIDLDQQVNLTSFNPFYTITHFDFQSNHLNKPSRHL